MMNKNKQFVYLREFGKNNDINFDFNEITLKERLFFSALLTKVRRNDKRDLGEIIFDYDHSRTRANFSSYDNVNTKMLMKQYGKVFDYITTHANDKEKNNWKIHAINIDIEKVFLTRNGHTSNSMNAISCKVFALAAAESKCRNEEWASFNIYDWCEVGKNIEPKNLCTRKSKIKNRIKKWTDEAGIEIEFVNDLCIIKGKKEEIEEFTKQKNRILEESKKIEKLVKENPIKVDDEKLKHYDDDLPNDLQGIEYEDEPEETNEVNDYGELSGMIEACESDRQLMELNQKQMAELKEELRVKRQEEEIKEREEFAVEYSQAVADQKIISENEIKSNIKLYDYITETLQDKYGQNSVIITNRMIQKYWGDIREQVNDIASKLKIKPEVIDKFLRSSWVDDKDGGSAMKKILTDKLKDLRNHILMAEHDESWLEAIPKNLTLESFIKSQGLHYSINERFENYFNNREKLFKLLKQYLKVSAYAKHTKLMSLN